MNRGALVVFALGLILAASPQQAESPVPGAAAPKVEERWWFNRPSGQLIFFAVLEGLYLDGVPSEVVDLIAPPAGQGWPPEMPMSEAPGKSQFNSDHFVYSCPLCHPAFEAFRLYRERRPFYGQKGRSLDTFGEGQLDGEMLDRLRSSNADKRRQAIQSLIQGWIERRLSAMRLTAEQRKALLEELEGGRRQGMRTLETLSKGRRTSCPICDASHCALESKPDG